MRQDQGSPFGKDRHQAFIAGRKGIRLCALNVNHSDYPRADL